ncbi:Transposon Ty3-I Gag-Pol polyprotein [Smittium mucronatum]|uniref:Transposon Ty3-I Gag-Pol polyprotein n=1 Tax=Smittium mucronatum TaxID=133383 RepID=A0A1R0GU97_9FUNG|nr:Transposon Ty3-I Gag-Pol polyprotein [Smittium mucronatum]
MPSGLNATEWKPLVLVASAVDCIHKADPKILLILWDVPGMFYPNPKIIKTDFSHRLRLATANPIKIPNANGTSRVLIDFRQLNKVTFCDDYPLMRIDIIFNQLFGCRIYSNIDVLKVFYQIPLHSDSVEASLFSTPYGHHEFLVMPQEIYNSSAMFQRNIDIQQQLDDKGFKLNQNKCIFAVPKVEILCFTVSKHVQEIINYKIAAFKEFSYLTSITMPRRFLEMNSFCRSFIENSTELAAPLFTLLQKETDINWYTNCETSLKNPKMAMLFAPVLLIQKCQNHMLWSQMLQKLE